MALGGSGGGGLSEFHLPVYNVLAPQGVPAQFGFDLAQIETFLDAGVRGGEDDGITEHIDNIPQRSVMENSITVWGVPADPSHDPERCSLVEGEGYVRSVIQCTSDTIFEPTDILFGITEVHRGCEHWEESNATAEASFESPAPTGCGRLVDFSPSILVVPDTSATDTPAGLTVDVRSPQGLNPEGLATAGIRNQRSRCRKVS